VKHVQGHNVKHSNRNNSPADCSISLKMVHIFIRSQAIYTTNVQGQRSKVKVTA